MKPLGPFDERKAIAALACLFAVSAAFVLVHPHSLENPTVPDERAYYGWAKLYNNGTYAVRLPDWFGIHDAVELYANATGVFYLDIARELATRDAVGADNDLVVTVSLPDGTPMAGATVVLRAQPAGLVLSATAGADGTAVFPNLKPGGYGLEVTVFRPPPRPGDPPLDLHAVDFVSVGKAGEPYRTDLAVDSVAPSGTAHVVTLAARDSLGAAVAGADILVGRKGPIPPDPTKVGETDGTGAYALTLSQPGSYVVIAEKAGERAGIPIASIVESGGEFYAVNRWAPGFSILLGLFLMAGIAGAVNLVLFAVASAAVYLLARRMFGWRVAALAATIAMTCGIALLAIWETGMADYASMAFALAGVALFQEALARKRSALVGVLALLAGLSLGASVCIRYSTATLVVVPFAMLAVAVVRASPRRRRFRVPDAATVRRFAIPLVALVLGLAIPAALLIQYNVAYFGGPLGSAYEYGGTIVVEGTGDNTTARTTSGTFYENFNPASALETLATRMGWLLLVMPFILFVPLAVWAGRREPAILVLAVFFLSNFALYAFVPWAGTGEATRAMEDMRYFLPGMPAAAVLASWVLSNRFTRVRARKVLTGAIVVLLVLCGFAAAGTGMALQDARLRMGGLPPSGPPQPPPPPVYKAVAVADLFARPALYNNTLVEVGNATFWRWLAPAQRFLMNQSGAAPIAVALVGFAAPSMTLGDLLLVRGVFRWTDGDRDGIADPPEVVITVTGGTADSVTVIP